MNLTNISLSNLQRRKAKAAFVLVGLLIGVTAVVAFLSLVDALTRDINEKLEKYGANIMIVPKTENLSLTYGGLSIGGISFEMQEILQEDLEKIKGIENAANVAAVGPMVLGPLKVGERNVLLAGVDVDALRFLRPWWKVQGNIPDKDGVIIGAEASRIMGIKQGDNLSANGRNLMVTGVLEPTGSQDDQIIFAHLSTAQMILGKEGRISMAEVAALCSACPIDEMVRQISGAVPGAKVMAIRQVVKGRMETLGHFNKFAYGLSALVVLIGGLVVLVTMMGSVRERTSEFGIFMAIGFRRSHIIRMVLFEAGLISAIAGVLGYITGFGATFLTVPFFTESVGVKVSFDPVLAGGVLVVAIVLGLVASLYPALIAGNLDPNEALRSL
ncbi:MAG: ABC transporter permease [Candidatus Brocadiales bacterium]|nr:ABC transporter permease [Candidatus Brocadiales bacterium]